jgi:hypothetical protein
LNNVLNTPPHHVTRWSDAALMAAGRLQGLRLEHLEHETLSKDHETPFAKARLLRFARKHLGLKLPMISRAAASFFGRTVFYCLAKPAEWMLSVDSRRAAGHSVVAVYRRS